MRAGETIHTENSHKYDLRSATMLLLAGGWEPVARYTDAGHRSVDSYQLSHASVAPFSPSTA